MTPDERRRAKRRREWMSSGLGDPTGWKCDGEEHHFGGGRTCVCGRRVKRAFVLTRQGGPARGVEVYLGGRYAISALAYITGGLANDGGQDNAENNKNSA